MISLFEEIHKETALMIVLSVCVIVKWQYYLCEALAIYGVYNKYSSSKWLYRTYARSALRWRYKQVIMKKNKRRRVAKRGHM